MTALVTLSAEWEKRKQNKREVVSKWKRRKKKEKKKKKAWDRKKRWIIQLLASNPWLDELWESVPKRLSGPRWVLSEGRMKVDSKGLRTVDPGAEEGPGEVGFELEPAARWRRVEKKLRLPVLDRVVFVFLMFIVEDWPGGSGWGFGLLLRLLPG
jgi:hypothetical protein